MNDELAIYTVLWTCGGQSYLIDFDDEGTALTFARMLEEATDKRRADVMVSGPQTPEMPIVWLEAARERMWAAIVARRDEQLTETRIHNIELHKEVRDLTHMLTSAAVKEASG